MAEVRVGSHHGAKLHRPGLIQAPGELQPHDDSDLEVLASSREKARVRKSCQGI